MNENYISDTIFLKNVFFENKCWYCYCIFTGPYNRVLVLGILFVLTLSYVQAKRNLTLTSKENLSDISLAEDSDKTHEEKKKRDLPPKLQEKVISILNVIVFSYF